MGLVRVSFLKGSSRRHDTFVVCANVSLFESKLLTRWITFSINQIRAFVVCGYPGRPTILDLVTRWLMGKSYFMIYVADNILLFENYAGNGTQS